MKRTRLLSALAAAALAVCVAIPAAASAKPTITMSGSTSVAPLAALLAQKYLRSAATASTSSCCRAAPTSASPTSPPAASRSATPRATRSRPIRAASCSTRSPSDAICIITNNANPVPGSTRPASRRSSAAACAAGAGVPGSTQTGTIDVFVRTAGIRVPRTPSRRSSWARTKIFGGASQKASNGLVQQIGQSDPNAIGYVSLSFTKGVHAIPYKGVACTLRNAKSGQYGGVRNFYMVTRGAPTGAAKKWINWITHSKAASKIIATALGAAALVTRPTARRPRQPERPHRPARRASCSARWRPRSCC